MFNIKSAISKLSHPVKIAVINTFFSFDLIILLYEFKAQ